MIDVGSSSLSAENIDWAIGESRLITSADRIIPIGATSLAICRKDAVSISPNDYPDFYSIINSSMAAGYWTVRGATGISAISGIGFDGASTLVAAGVGGVSMSADKGMSFSLVSSDSVDGLGTPGFLKGVWLIPSAVGVLRKESGQSGFKLVPGSPLCSGTQKGAVYPGKNNILLRVSSSAGTDWYVSKDLGLTYSKISLVGISNMNHVASDGNGQFAARCWCSGDYGYAYSVDDGLSFNYKTVKLNISYTNIYHQLSEYVWTGRYFVQGGFDNEQSATALITEGVPTFYLTDFVANKPVIQWAQPKTGYTYTEGYWFMPLCGVDGGLLAVASPMIDVRFFQNSTVDLFFFSNESLERMANDYEFVKSQTFPYNVGATLVAKNVIGVSGSMGAAFYLAAASGNTFYSHFKDSVQEIPLQKWTPPSAQPGANFYTRIK